MIGTVCCTLSRLVFTPLQHTLLCRTQVQEMLKNVVITGMKSRDKFERGSAIAAIWVYGNLAQSKHVRIELRKRYTLSSMMVVHAL
jgi:hypothetical protein